ncbi:entericidin A/B family lipoprotein [Parerythrobacter aestuarii]|nr:entericidin A/B family lipoprotein [Parerythrobacter aestuarii]
MARKALIALGIVAISLTTAACNTVKGLGRDIQSVGEAGEDAID